MTAIAPSLRDRRRAETRSLIHDAALALVDERGYEGVTVESISDRAGISVRTFFNYFATKESAIILSLPPLPPEAVDTFLNGSDAATLFTDLAEVAVAHVGLHEGPTTLEATMRIIRAAPALVELQFVEFAHLERELIALVAARLRTDLDDARSQLFAATFMSAVRTAATRWSSRPDDGTIADQIRCCAELLTPLTAPVGGARPTTPKE